MNLFNFFRPSTVEGAVSHLIRSVENLGIVAEVKRLEAEAAEVVAADATKVAQAARREIAKAEDMKRRVEAMLYGDSAEAPAPTAAS